MVPIILNHKSGDRKKGGARLPDEAEAKQLSIQLDVVRRSLSQAGKRKRLSLQALGLDLHPDPREP